MSMKLNDDLMTKSPITLNTEDDDYMHEPVKNSLDHSGEESGNRED